MLTLLTRERLLIISGILSILLCVGVFLYIRAAGQADQAYREGEIREEQVAALQEQAKRTEKLGKAREARLAEVLEEKREEKRKSQAEIIRLKKAIPKQTPQEVVDTFQWLIEAKPEDPKPKLSTDEQHVVIEIEEHRKNALLLAKLAGEAAKVPSLEAHINLLVEEKGNLITVRELEEKIIAESGKAVAAYKKSAKKGRFRRIIGTIAKPALFIAGLVVGSKL